MKRLALLLGFALFLLMPSSVAAADCQFVLGFATLRDIIGHDIVGECLESEHYGANGDSLQQTTGGLLVWRKADNWTAFTDGYRTWINGPYGLEQRFNIELLPWEAEGAIERLPWVQDGLNSLEMQSVSLLERLGEHYSQVLLVLLETERDWLPPQQELHISLLEEIVRMSAFDEVAVRHIVGMPFLKEIETYDSDALRAFSSLILTGSEHVPGIAAHPALTDSRTEADGVTILLLILKAQDPEAAARIESMAWVRDGLESSEHRSADSRVASRFEQYLVEDLVSLAHRSRPLFLTLADKPWIQDNLDQYEYQLISDIASFSYSYPVLAQRLTAMPFLQAVDAYEVTIIQTIKELRPLDDQLPSRVLDHPALAGGITDDHTGDVFLVVMELVAPQETVAIHAFPWVQDGIANSELGGIQALQLLALSSPQVLQAIMQRNWLRDGISKDEQDVVRSLHSILGWHWVSDRNEALTQRIIEMPFLESIESLDAAALDSLEKIYGASGLSQLQGVLSHPTLHDGISDDHVARVAVLSTVARKAPELLESVLTPREAFVAQRTLTFPALGTVEVAVASMSHEASENMEWLAHAIRTYVEFMGVPFPTNYVTLWVHSKGGGGGGASGHLNVGSLSDPATVAHEAAHVYWPFFPSWLSEGGAVFLEQIAQNARVGSPIRPYNNGKCQHANTLSEHDRLVYERGQSGQHGYLGICPYSLGSGLFVDLYNTLGDRWFREGFRRLYLKLEHNEHYETCYGVERGICYLKAAFLADADPQAAAAAAPVINRWYYGSKHGPQLPGQRIGGRSTGGNAFWQQAGDDVSLL